MGNFDNFPRKKNPYFDFRKPEYDRDKNLFSLVATEAFNKFGVCMEFYVTTYDLQYEPIWGEDNNRRFVKKFDLMVYYQLPREEKMWNNYGIENIDTFSMYSSKRHFRAASKPTGGVEYIPKIGDIIMAKYNDYVYEVTEVAEEVSMFLQSKEHMWEFVVKPFKDEGISMDDSLSGCTLSAFTNKDEDIFDISNPIDVEKENIIYKPPAEEKPNDDPFANW
tara:strand:- start:32956 stop:33618 length:663 start_codon:yes stop_codon:yes gene_type:complete